MLESGFARSFRLIAEARLDVGCPLLLTEVRGMRRSLASCDRSEPIAQARFHMG
jgi:hypothetical protein